LLKPKFTDLVGCEIPIQQAAMGDIAVPRLASAVANAGALGMTQPSNDRDPRHVEKMIEETNALTKKGKVFGMSFLVPVAPAYFQDDLSPIFESVETASKNAQSHRVLLSETGAQDD
jgi:NAD(P)H-dependent flavin oxidoreductase YrpB (nitropropane dioxygenase family)